MRSSAISVHNWSATNLRFSFNEAVEEMMQELQKREEEAIVFDQSLPRRLERSLIVVELFLPGRKKGGRK